MASNSDDDFAEPTGSASVYAAFNAFYDEELETPGLVPPAPVVVAPPYRDDSDVGAGSGSSDEDDFGAQQAKKQLTHSKAAASKRRKRSGARFENAANDSDDGA